MLANETEGDFDKPTSILHESHQIIQNEIGVKRDGCFTATVDLFMRAFRKKLMTTEQRTKLYQINMKWKANRETNTYKVAAVMVGYGHVGREEYLAMRVAIKDRFNVRIRAVGSIPSRGREADFCFLVHKDDEYAFRRGRWVGDFYNINYLGDMKRSDYPSNFVCAYSEHWNGVRSVRVYR